MPQMRTLLLTLASGPLLAPSVASALGLGEISLYSALNQPLDARIELIDAEGLDANDFRVRLAGEADFARAGVERLYSLNDLRFTPVLSGGQRYIRVQSSQNMREPYLNFLIVVARPGGQLLREYTLLFDPPESSAYRQQAASLPSPARIEAPVRSQISVPKELPSAERGERYQVRRGDSLWLIARRLQQAGSAAPLQRLMEGILALNPHAFIGGDASRLKADVSLLLPDEASPFREPAPVPAQAEPAAQSEAAPAASVPAPVPASEQAEVTPVAPEALQPVAGQAALESAPAAVAELQRRLDDELQANQQQNAQLQAQLQNLGHQLDSLQQSLRERDEQIAALEARLAQAEVAPQAESQAPVVVSMPAEPSGGVWHWWLASSLLLGALVVGGLFWRGRSRAPQPAPLAPRSQEPLAKPVTVVNTPKVVSEQLAPATPARNSDPLAAANVYIAYGNFAEAAASLRRALEEEPQRHELRLRLLEVLGQTGDQVGFQRELAVLQGVPECATALARIRELYAPSAKPAASVPEPIAPLNEAKPLLEDDFKLNLEDLPLDADWDQLEPFQPARPAKTEAVEPEPQIDSDLSSMPEVFEMSHGELGELPPAFERRTVPRREGQVEDTSPWDREPVSKTLSEFRSYEQEHDLSHLEGKREHLSQLNQALAYIEQGNLDEACNILNQLISDGSEEQKREAKALLSRIA